MSHHHKKGGKKEEPTREKKPAKKETTASTSSTTRAGSSSAPLKEKNPNSTVKDKRHEKEKRGSVREGKAPAIATSVTTVPAKSKLDGRRFDIKFKAHHMKSANSKDIWEFEDAREKRFLRAIAKSRALITSFMAGESTGKGKASASEAAASLATGSGGEGNLVPEFEMDFLNTFNTPIDGSFSRMWVEIYFGKNPRSAPIELAVDTGSAAIYVNDKVYISALNKTRAKEGAVQFGKTAYLQYSEGDIFGKLYKDSVSLFRESDSKKVYIKDQLFGVVDENRNPEARRWRKELDVNGIFGIGPRALTKGIIHLDQPGSRSNQPSQSEAQELPTIIDNMKAQDLIAEEIVGIHYGLPNEGKRRLSDSIRVDSGPDAGTAKGELHFGAPRWSVFNRKSLRWIPATKKGDSQNFYGVDLKLSYNGETFMEESSGFMDTGTYCISLPRDALDKYFRAIQKASGRADPVITYDERCMLYYMKKSDYKLLKKVKFDFVKGEDAVFEFSPHQQVIPPRLARSFVADTTELVFLPFKVLTNACKGREFILGMSWNMWYYLILDSSETNKRIGIAKIDKQTDYVWKDL